MAYNLPLMKSYIAMFIKSVNFTIIFQHKNIRGSKHRSKETCFGAFDVLCFLNDNYTFLPPPFKTNAVKLTAVHVIKRTFLIISQLVIL